MAVTFAVKKACQVLGTGQRQPLVLLAMAVCVFIIRDY